MIIARFMAGDERGNGIIVGGQIYRGALGAGGELGHMIVDASGPSECPCGTTLPAKAWMGLPGSLFRLQKVPREPVTKAGLGVPNPMQLGP